MKSRLACIALLLAGGLAVNCKADYLFTYQDSAGNVIGFTEPTLQPSGVTTNFLFDKNSVNSFVFQGNAPSSCDGLGSLATGCTGLTNANALAHAVFPNGSFSSTGVFSGTNGAAVDIVQYSGYLFTYQDSNGDILAFSEPTLQPSDSTSQFLFSTAGVTSFSFWSNTSSCGALGSINGIGCTQLNNSLATSTVFPAGWFSSVGKFTGDGATVNIVQATATPEPSTAALFLLALALAGAFCRRQWYHTEGWSPRVPDSAECSEGPGRLKT
jgi:PEP-CTERM motif